MNKTTWISPLMIFKNSTIYVMVFCMSLSFCYAQDSISTAKRVTFNKCLQKGRYALGANFFYAPVTSPNWTTTGQAGYFIANKWISGIQVTLYGSNAKHDISPNGPYSKSSQFALSPEIFTRYYISSSRFRPFVQLAAGYKTYSLIKTLRATEQKETSKTNGITYGAAIGLSYQVTKRLNIELLYNHQYFKKKADLEDLRLRLGATVFF